MTAFGPNLADQDAPRRVRSGDSHETDLYSRRPRRGRLPVLLDEFGEPRLDAGRDLRTLAAGQLDPDAETVIINSGDGLKTLDAVAPTIPPIQSIRPTLEAFAALEQASSREAVSS